jgi:uncharacterized protein (DUF4213/DUF364 family)
METLHKVREIFEGLIRDHDLLGENVLIHFRPLTPEEAIGNPKRHDFPIIVGKEKLIEAQFRGKRAHVFTDSPVNYSGKIKEILEMGLLTNQERAIFVGALNATLKYLGMIEKTLHCKDEEPERCGLEIANILKGKGLKRVGLIGFNPAILNALVETFGKDSIRVTDLNGDNVGKDKFGVSIWDGRTMTEKLVRDVELLLITGTTFVNGTYDSILKEIKRYKKDHLIYGVTASGICKLMGLKSVCPYGRS